MSAPRTKRQFAGAASDPAQRHITSFFDRQQGGALPATVTTSPPSSPALPASVQANLLSVGMRVRKSVPEGYKTGSPYSGFALWADPDSCTGASRTTSSPLPPMPAPAAVPSRRELLPFCGINKVGGLASQPEYEAVLPSSAFSSDMMDSSSSSSASSAVPGLDDIPSLTSSQESAASTTSSSSAMLSAAGPAATNRKRFFSDEDDDGNMTAAGSGGGGGGGGGVEVPAVSDRLRVWRSDWLDVEVSPRSLAPVGWENARVLARPRAGKRRTLLATAAVAAAAAAAAAPTPSSQDVPLAELGQENIAMDDFEEAEFLEYEADVEMGEL